MNKLNIIKHPLIQYKIDKLRDKNTCSKDFRDIVNEVSMLLCYEATRNIELKNIEIETPLCKTEGKVLKNLDPVIIPILRAGLGMCNGFAQIIPSAKIGHIGLYRDPKTLKPIEYYCKLPPDCDKRDSFILDPMLATGGSSSAAITLLKEKNVTNINLVNLIAAPEGIEKIRKEHPDVTIYLGIIDEKLNDNGYILPGLGDAGDRIFGTK